MIQNTLWTAYLDTRVDTRMSRKERFLDCMEQVMPWTELLDELGDDTTGSHLGRKPMGVERKLRIYFMQQWFGLSDEGAIDLLLDAPCARAFCGFDASQEPMPNRTTLVKFRKWLREQKFADTLTAAVDAALDAAGIEISSGTMVDATVIEASGSTKNKAKDRDPDAGSTQKRGSWSFGYKLHIGTDVENNRIHSASVTSASRHDSQELPNLLQGDEKEVYGDSAYIGQQATLDACAPGAKDCTNERGTRGHPLDDEQKANNRQKSIKRARVEHPFRVIKCQFGHRHTRYRGLAKNTEQLRVLCALANVFTFRRALGVV